jgi:glycosyltransferase involved in cell wall biosynthesis
VIVTQLEHNQNIDTAKTVISNSDAAPTSSIGIAQGLSTDEPLRVLHYLGGLGIGGAEAMIMNIYRAIDRSRLQFDFVTHTPEQDMYEDEIVELGGRIFHVPRYMGKNHREYKRAWEKLLEKHPEFWAVHGHPASTSAIYLKIAKQQGLYTIVHSHNISHGRGMRALIKNILQYPTRFVADKFFACSKAAGVARFGERVCSSKSFSVIPNGIDLPVYRFDPAVRKGMRKKLGLANKIVLGHVGRMTEQKNHAFLLKIFNRVHQENEDTALLLVGDGELRKQIEAEVRKLGLQDTVILVGAQENVADYLQAMDLFVFPSLYEGLGIVLIEAQANGLKVLASEVIPEDVRILDSYESLDLRKGVEEWAKIILDTAEGGLGRGSDAQGRTRARGYDVNEVAVWLQEFYIKTSKSM